MNAVWTSFIENEHRKYVDKLLEIANPSNVEKIYTGHQSLPLHYGSNWGFKMFLRGFAGQISFQGSEDIDEMLYILALPHDSMKDLETNCSLEIKIESTGDHVDMIEFRDREKFTLFSEKRDMKNWTDAEEHCHQLGGHLATIRTPGEQREIEELLVTEWYRRA